MILMRVGQHQPHQILALLHQEGNIRHDQVDARQVLLVAERHAQIDRKPGALIGTVEAVYREIHADLADPAERCEGHFIHHTAPADATAPKYTSPAEIGSRLPSEVRTIMQPASSIVSNVPVTVEPPARTETGRPSPAARCSHLCRISAKPRPSSQMPRNSIQASDNAVNTCPA